MRRQIGAFVLCMLFSVGASAERGCPFGHMPVLVNSPQGGQVVNCVPGGSETQQQGAQPPPRRVVVERWEVFDDRFGAVAISANGAYGISFNQASSEAASSIAIRRCAERGGDDCEVLGSHKNLCSTYSWGSGQASVGSDRTVELSERRSLAMCQEKTRKACDVIETVCSEPVSRWVYEKPANWIPKRPTSD
jgi:hypothetical protein